MYNQPYFIPNFYHSTIPFMMRGSMTNNAIRGGVFANKLGLFSKLGNGLNTLKAINWKGFINNTSKTLGIINQTIPLVKQVGPMMNNMKSMLKVASLFKDETEAPTKKTTHQAQNVTKKTYQTSNFQPKKPYQEEDYSPTFFIDS